MSLDLDMTIMGIDPGTNILGFGVIHVFKKKAELKEIGVIDLRKEKDHFSKLKKLCEETDRILDEYKPDVLSVESPFYGKNPQVMLKLGRAQGAAITAALRRDIPVFEYAPRKAKMAITGNGAASKEQVSIMAQKILNVSIDSKFLDATDALALALCHFYALQDPLAGVKSSSDWIKFITENPNRIV